MREIYPLDVSTLGQKSDGSINFINTEQLDPKQPLPSEQGSVTLQSGVPTYILDDGSVVAELVHKINELVIEINTLKKWISGYNDNTY